MSLAALTTLTPIGALLLALVFAYLAVIRGWFIPRASHLRELTQERRRGDEWKETALSKDAVNAELLKQVGQLIENGKSAATTEGVKTNV